MSVTVIRTSFSPARQNMAPRMMVCFLYNYYYRPENLQLLQHVRYNYIQRLNGKLITQHEAW